ncbi:MAG: ankyrin repeat domain-containing protein [Candidatus Amoebophilus sp.]
MEEAAFTSNVRPIQRDKEHIEIVKLLIEKGVDINAQNENSCTSLHIVA